jgi:hypothetical protein
MHADEVPRYKGDEGIVQGSRDLGMPDGAVTVRMAHVAVMRREIQPTRIGHANWFSLRDIQEWLRSRKLAGSYADYLASLDNAVNE